ncbi:TetR/AcrR family transcriptional regulator [Kytococcus sedentarius]|uniref:TetR/AcrR family transcriptional regulator n=1 Tax=Kytococcus sedentarius TaxID=1276 RepID=UPI0035BC5BD5
MNVPRRGPRPAGADTRADILNAALELFSSRGYDAVSLRMVAREAGVDPALVNYYYGGKSALFVAAMRPEIDEELLASFLDGLTPQECGEQVIEFVLTFWSTHDTAVRMTGTFFAAPSQAEEQEYLQDLILRRFLDPVVERLCPDHHALRTELVSVLLMGMMAGSSVLGYPRLDALSIRDRARLLGPACHEFLVGELPPIGDDGRPSTEGESLS